MVYYCAPLAGFGEVRGSGWHARPRTAPSSHFASAPMARKRYLIVGDGAAGLTAAEELRRRDPEAAVGLLCDDPNPGYFRAALTNFLLGELREDQLWAVAPDFYEARRIDRIFTRVLRVDPLKRELWCSGNPTPLGYDALLVASGARARPPAFAGAHLPGVLTLRTIQDARRIVDALRGNLKQAVILGAGALGLEWTHALLERGVRVTLLERGARLLPNALDAVASDLLAARLRQAGAELLVGEEVAHAEPAANGAVGAIVTNKGRRVACDLVAAALGIVPNSELVEHSNVERAPNGAIKVGRTLASSAPGIWAAGDVANVEGEQLGLWEPARHQGRVAAVNMSGGSEEYRPGVHYFATRLFDLDFARVGEIAEAPARTALVDFPRGTGHIAYRKLVLEGGRVKGALLIGERQAKVRGIGRGLKRLIDAQADVGPVAQRLLDPSFDVSGFLETRKLLAPPEAQPAATRAVPAAKLRGTQAVSLSIAFSGLTARAGTAFLDSAARPLLPAAPGTVALPPSSGARAASTSLLASRTSLLPSPTSLLASRTSLLPASAPRSTRVLSIGLHAEAAAEPLPSDAAIDARLTLGGHSFVISGKLSNIGSAPDSSIRLNEPGVAFLHAQITEHAGALYLRDAGTQTGTWVNGVPLTSAHALRDGDRIVVGRAELAFVSSTLAKSVVGNEPLIAAPRLELRSGAGLGLSFLLTTEACSIGSGQAADLRIFDASIAPLHARVRKVQELHQLSDLGSASGTYLRGQRLPAGQEVVLGEGELVQLGAVVVAYTRAPTRDRLAAFRPMARLSVTSGAGAGQVGSFEERLLVGSAAEAGLRLPGTAPWELELVRHQGGYFARDLSAGRTFKSGAPLGPEYAPLKQGEMLLLSSGALLRFEET
jgi:NADPH-dependent 2,4-dienoyl-CoA reductase/sulfur reductase-like enzyme/pSer/pThr/pTyr-binding forkhead associated (FHA) protein